MVWAERSWRVFFDFARAHDLRFITLEVRTSNLPAIAMYRSLGFTEAGVRRNFYTEPREDALIFTLSF